MNIPNIPTDNLYKFIALSGVMLIIFGFFIQFYSSYFVLEPNKNLVKVIREIEYKSTNLKQDIENFEDKITNNSTKNQKNYYLNELIKFNNRYEELSKEMANLEGIFIYVKDLTTIVEASIKLGKITIIEGSIFSSLGFLLWYYKVQKYEDIILKKKTKGC